MSKKRKVRMLFLWIFLVLLFVVSPILPQRHTEVWAAETTITVEDEKFYQALKNGLTPAGKCVDSTRKITLDMGKVTKIDIAGIDMKRSDSANLLNQLLSGCKQLQSLHLNNCDLSEFELEVLKNAPNLTSLWLDRCKLSKIDFIKNTGGG